MGDYRGRCDGTGTYDHYKNGKKIGNYIDTNYELVDLTVTQNGSVQIQHWAGQLWGKDGPTAVPFSSESTVEVKGDKETHTSDWKDGNGKAYHDVSEYQIDEDGTRVYLGTNSNGKFKKTTGYTSDYVTPADTYYSVQIDPAAKPTTGKDVWAWSSKQYCVLQLQTK